MATKDYSTTSGNNTSINSISVAEGMSPSAVNNAMREIIKDSRDSWNEKEWFILGDGDQSTTFTRASATSVTVGSDISSSHHVGRRVKIVGTNTGTIYGKIATSSYSSPNTTITFTFDSGTIDSSDTTVDVYVGSTYNNPATPVIDEDNMASDSAILPPSQQSVKAYVDSQVTAQDLDFQGDTGGALSIDLDSETLTIAGGTGIDTSGATNTLTVAIDSTVATLTDTQTLTNKTLTTPVISSISNTGTLTLPTSTDTLVGRATTDTLTNKTISGSSNTISNIANSSLTNSTVSFGGVSLPLGGTDVTPAFDLTDAINYPTSSLSGTITNAQLAGSIAGTKLLDSAITTAKINDSAVTTAKINNDAVTIDKIADSVIVTNAEHSSHTPDDSSFFTTSASDARYFRQDSSETISSGDTWSASDSYVATTSAIDARVIDLVDDVGGFVPIANETSFPTTNPDVNDGAGTIVSVSAIGTTRTPSSGTVTIANGSGSNTVTITGCGSTELTAGYGVLVETTSTLHTYTFHRLVPKATEVTTVAGVATEIALLGTADAVSDMNTLGTSANVTAMDNCSGSIANINTVATDIANVNTTASNISGVNSFAERYRVSATAPTTSLDTGDLYFDTATNEMKVYGSSGWQSAGSSVNGTSQRYNYTATSGQTTFTGLDNNGNTLTYDAGYIDVYLNGVKLLNGTDVTVTSGSSVVLASGASTGDIIDIVAYGTFSVASLNADNLDSGTVPSARVSGAYTGITEVGTLNGLDVTGTVVSDGLTVDGDATFGGAGDTVVFQTNSNISPTYFSRSTVTDQSLSIGVDDNDVFFNSIQDEQYGGFEFQSTYSGTGTRSRLSIANQGDISFYEDTGTTPKLFWDASAERLGIGTSSPANPLEIAVNTTTNQNSIHLNNTGTMTVGQGSSILFRNGTVTVGDKASVTGIVTSTTSGARGTGLSFSTDAQAVGLTEKVRIDHNGNVGIGTSSPTNGKLVVKQSTDAQTGGINIQNTGGGAFYLWQDGSGNTNLDAAAAGSQLFKTGNTERMRIDSSGDLFIGKSSVNFSVAGIRLNVSNQKYSQFTRDNGGVIDINRLTSDGELVAYHQDGTKEGNITVSGTTVSYNGFTGTHWSRLTDNSKPTILKGTILESLDEMMDWYQVQFDVTETDDEGNETTTTQKQSYVLGDGQSVGDVITYTYEGTDYQATIIQEGDVKHTKSKISDTVDAKNVYGVFVDWDNDDDTVNDMYVAQTGTFVVRMNSAETVSKGDLIQSNGDGTGKVQADDIIRSSTVAKILSTTKIETYEDGSYIVPCSLHC